MSLYIYGWKNFPEIEDWTNIWNWLFSSFRTERKWYGMGLGVTTHVVTIMTDSQIECSSEHQFLISCMWPGYYERQTWHAHTHARVASDIEKPMRDKYGCRITAQMYTIHIIPILTHSCVMLLQWWLTNSHHLIFPGSYTLTHSHAHMQYSPATSERHETGAMVLN